MPISTICRGVKVLPSLQQVGERRPVDPFHRDVGLTVLLAHVEHRDDVRVRQDSGAFRLAQEARAVFVVGEEVRLERLDGERAVDLRVVGLVDARHRAFARHLVDLVSPDFLHELPPRGCLVFAPHSAARCPRHRVCQIVRRASCSGGICAAGFAMARGIRATEGAAPRDGQRVFRPAGERAIRRSAALQLRADLAAGILRAVHVDVSPACLVARALRVGELRGHRGLERVVAGLREGNDDRSVGAGGSLRGCARQSASFRSW